MAHAKNRLSERAMLTSLNVSIWMGRKKDKAVTDRVQKDANAERDCGNWYTYAIPPKELNPIVSAQIAGRNIHYQYTLPWSDNGERILTTDMFLEYSAKMSEAKARFEKAVADFIARYPAIVQQARQALGKLFQAEYYPPASVVAGKFAWTVSILPMPEVSDLRVSIGDDEFNAIQANVEGTIVGRVTAATKDAWQRLYDVVETAANTLAEKDKIFRDSLIGNVKALCDILPKLNIANDSRLNDMVKEVSDKITKLSAEELRTNKRSRKEAVNKAQDILKKMKTIMG